MCVQTFFFSRDDEFFVGLRAGKRRRRFSGDLVLVLVSASLVSPPPFAPADEAAARLDVVVGSVRGAPRLAARHVQDQRRLQRQRVERRPRLRRRPRRRKLGNAREVFPVRRAGNVRAPGQAVRGHTAQQTHQVRLGPVRDARASGAERSLAGRVFFFGDFRRVALRRRELGPRQTVHGVHDARGVVPHRVAFGFASLFALVSGRLRRRQRQVRGGELLVDPDAFSSPRPPELRSDPRRVRRRRRRVGRAENLGETLDARGERLRGGPRARIELQRVVSGYRARLLAGIVFTAAGDSRRRQVRFRVRLSVQHDVAPRSTQESALLVRLAALPGLLERAEEPPEHVLAAPRGGVAERRKTRRVLAHVVPAARSEGAVRRAPAQQPRVARRVPPRGHAAHAIFSATLFLRVLDRGYAFLAFLGTLCVPERRLQRRLGVVARFLEEHALRG